jgi:hypothetical protein
MMTSGVKRVIFGGVALVLVACALASATASAFENAPVRREILALYDGAREGSADASRIHRFAELPLNHLGFILRFHDMREPLPAPEDMARYQGVLTWFAGPVPDGNQYLAWAAQVSRTDLHYVVLGDVGVDISPGNLVLVNRLMGSLGLHHTGAYITPTLGTHIAHKDSELVEFECRLDPLLPEYPVIEVEGDGVRVGLALEAPEHEGKLVTNLVTINSKGGFAAFTYEFCHQHAPLHQGKWLIDPFTFFRLAFGAEVFPIPDTTTVSGRRLYFAQLQSEGWSNPSEIERYRRPGAIAADAVLQELIEPFPDLPVTLDLRESDMNKSPASTEHAHTIADRTFSLSQVERPGHHSVGTLRSRFDARYPSISNLAALVSSGPEPVFYAATGNETSYESGGQFVSIGFHSLRETIEKTESPRRLKGFNLNFHAYAGQHPALLQAVTEHLAAARTAAITPVAASRYAAIADGFFTTLIEKTGDARWQIRNRGALQTVRFEDIDDREVDLEASIGVLGQTRHANALYVALDEAIEPAIVTLRKSVPAASSHEGIALVGSRWLVSGLDRGDCSHSFQAKGYGQGEFFWSGADHARYAITARRDGQELWRQSVTADSAGHLTFVVAAKAVEPVTIQMTCDNAGGG